MFRREDWGWGELLLTERSAKKGEGLSGPRRALTLALSSFTSNLDPQIASLPESRELQEKLEVSSVRFIAGHITPASITEPLMILG